MTSFGKYEYSTANEPLKLQKLNLTHIIFQDHPPFNTKIPPFEALSDPNQLKTSSINGATHIKKTLICYFETRKKVQVNTQSITQRIKRRKGNLEKP